MNRVLEIGSDLSDDTEMMTNAPTSATFEQDATEVLTSLKGVLKTIIAALGVRRAVELQRALNLQHTLCWQIFKLINERSVLAAGASVPSRASITRFTTAAAKGGVPSEVIKQLSSAYDEFERLIERHAGDRTSFKSLVASAAGLRLVRAR